MTRGDQINPPPQRPLDDGDWTMPIRVLMSGEDVEYLLNDLLADPSEV